MTWPPAGKPLYVGAQRTFAFFHDAEPRGRTGVLICAPFGWEDMCSYRVRREWAQQLAAAGHPALRFDLPASGDSPGSPGDADRVSSWTACISEAAQWLRQETGASAIAAIGIGMGGLLAARAALQGAPIDELVLWGVPTRGRALVRELRAFSRMEVANVGEPPPTAPAPPDGLIANGYLLSGQTTADLEALDLQELKGTGAIRRALLLSRDGLRVDEQLEPTLAGAGASVTVAAGDGYGAMTVEPQEARAPTEVFRRVESWLSEDDTPSSPGPAPAPAGTPAAATLPLTQDGTAISERPMFFDGPGGRLFGILSEPAGPRQELCAVLLNAGPQRHTGPNRMWVETARRWAAQGVPTLRVDMAAIGDSDGDSAQLVRVASLYDDSYVEQVEAVLDGLAGLGYPERFLLMGLCSGAYWSMHTALSDTRVAGIVMLNPRALIWDEFEYAVRRTQELRERLLLRETWSKVLHGEITLARHMETAKAIAGRARERILSRSQQPEPSEQPIDRLFDSLRERDQRVLMLLTGREPLRDDLSDTGLLDRLERWPNLELVLTGSPADTHTLTPAWLQAEVARRIDAALQAELGRLGRAPVRS